jgi:hypothetical protein
MQVKTCDVVYDDSIRCRMLDLRCRTNIRHRMAAMSYVLRHRMLRCRTCLTYDIDIRCRTSCTYDIVGVRCRTCMTYDIVCNIGIIRCRTSDVRHRTSARIQMDMVYHYGPAAATPSRRGGVCAPLDWDNLPQCRAAMTDCRAMQLESSVATARSESTSARSVGRALTSSELPWAVPDGPT